MIFSSSFIRICKITKVVYDAAIDTALLKTRIADIPDDSYGFTTNNLWIFLSDLADYADEILIEAGTFINFVRKMFNYFRRCRCNAIGESLQIHTPQNSVFNTDEGGLIDEYELFGGIICFLRDIGAQYLLTNLKTFSIESFIPHVELKHRGHYNGNGLILSRSKHIETNCVLRFESS